MANLAGKARVCQLGRVRRVRRAVSRRSSRNDGAWMRGLLERARCIVTELVEADRLAASWTLDDVFGLLPDAVASFARQVTAAAGQQQRPVSGSPRVCANHPPQG